MNCPAVIKESTIYTSVFYKDIQQARKDTNTNPSEAQIKAENYKKGTFRWNGLVIKIENPKGSTRSGTSSDGKKWSIQMKYDYGYIAEAQKSKDNDAIDVFIGDHPESQVVYVIDQMFNGKFDEHKCVIGALDEEEARKTYLANYEKGWKGLGQIKALTVEQFKEWVKEGNTRKAINKQELFKVSFKYTKPQHYKKFRLLSDKELASAALRQPDQVKFRKAISKMIRWSGEPSGIRTKSMAVRRLNSKEISHDHFDKIINSLSKLK